MPIQFCYVDSNEIMTMSMMKVIRHMYVDRIVDVTMPFLQQTRAIECEGGAAGRCLYTPPDSVTAASHTMRAANLSGPRQRSHKSLYEFGRT